MLNGIKNLINQKKAFQEAAEIILENDQLDDSIILGEAPEEPELDMDKKDKDPVSEPEDSAPVSEPETPVEDQPVDNGPAPVSDGDNNVMDAPVDGPSEEPMPLPGSDGLPTPVGRQTGEPIDDNNDILTAEIDLASNTVRDVLPTPPGNAAEAIADEDDIMNQRVDSGFEDEAPAPSDPTNDLLNSSIEEREPEAAPEPEEPAEPAEESSDILSEAITLDGNDGGDEKKDQGSDSGSAAPGDASSAPPAEDKGESEPAPAEDPPAEESPVTAAVKDKVAEMDTEDTTGMSDNTGNVELMKKLGSLTKGLEDVKKAVMDKIQ